MKYEIWMEGYRASIEHQQAQKIWDSFEAGSFNDACEWLMKRRPDMGIQKSKTFDGREYYAIWACELFDNEADARKSFG